MRRASFAQAPIGEGASALNRVFERYLVPVAFTPEQLHLHMTYNDVDAAASPLWYDDGGAVLAAALLGIRGTRGWIGGFGVAPEHRGRGYAAQLLLMLETTARERGLHSIQLEVLAGNAPALHVYRSAGYHIVRTLRSFERIVENAREPAGFAAAPIEDCIDRSEPVSPCWQRERAAILNGAASTAVRSGENYALFRYNAQAAQVLELGCGNAVGLDRLANAIAWGRGLARVTLLNEPEESPIARYARTAAWNEPFVQYEMGLDLRVL